MGFQVPSGYKVQLPNVPQAQRVKETGGDVSLMRARERFGETMGAAVDLAGEIYGYKMDQQVSKAQNAYRQKISDLEMELTTNPLASPREEDSASMEERAMPNHAEFLRRRDEIADEVTSEHLDIWGSGQRFQQWREGYDPEVEQRIKGIDIAKARKDRIDVFTESVDGIIQATTAENSLQQRSELTREVLAAVENRLIDTTQKDDILDAGFRDIRERGIRARLDAALSAGNYSLAETILNDPDTWYYKTYDNKDAWVEEKVRSAFRDYVAGEKSQHLRELDAAEAELANQQYQQIIRDFDQYGTEKLRYLMDDTARYATLFERQPQQMERWYRRLQAMEAAEEQALEQQQEGGEESAEERRTQRIEELKKNIERKIEAGVDHDEVDRLISEAGQVGLLDSSEMSTYYRRNESRNPDEVREWMFQEIEDSRASEEEKARMTTMLQRELARINMQEGAANLSMEDASTMLKNITDPVNSAEIAELINNRIVRWNRSYAKGRSVWAQAGEITEEQADPDAVKLSAREREAQQLYEQRSLYGTADPQLIATLAFEEHLGDPDEVLHLVDPGYEQRSRREQRVLRANVRAGLIARDHLQQFTEKWGAESIVNTYVTALGTLVIETDGGYRWRRYTPPDSYDSIWQYKRKTSTGWSEIWQTYEWGG